jgi:hypothetical protein
MTAKSKEPVTDSASVIAAEKPRPAPKLKVKDGSYVIENGDFVHLDKSSAR